MFTVCLNYVYSMSTVCAQTPSPHEVRKPALRQRRSNLIDAELARRCHEVFRKRTVGIRGISCFWPLTYSDVLQASSVIIEEKQFLERCACQIVRQSFSNTTLFAASCRTHSDQPRQRDRTVLASVLCGLGRHHV